MNRHDWEQLQAFKRRNAAKRAAPKWRRVTFEQIATEPAMKVPCAAHDAPIGVACRPSPRAVCPGRCEHAAHVAPPDRDGAER